MLVVLLAALSCAGSSVEHQWAPGVQGQWQCWKDRGTHAQREKPLGNIAPGRAPHRAGPSRGQGAASSSQRGGGQAGLARRTQGCFQVHQQQKQDAVLTCSDHITARSTLGTDMAQSPASNAEEFLR